MSDRLLAALRDLPIEWPDVPSVSPDLLGNHVRVGRPVRFGWVPAVVVAVLLLTVGVVTPVREAVADWLGVGVIRVVQVDRLPDDMGSRMDLGISVPVASVDLSWPEGLGPPTQAWTRDGEVSLAWTPSSSLPAVGDRGVGAVLTRFDGTLDPVVEKSIGEGTTLQIVTIGGLRAYWIEGEPHSLAYLDDEGRVVQSTARLAGNALVWQEGGATFRLEVGLDLAGVQRILAG